MTQLAASLATSFDPHCEMILGIVSNCWRLQLAEGVPLELLVEKAEREGYRAIELRQGCLGEYETAGDFVPIVGRLAEFSQRFPEMRFNIALAFPFFDPQASMWTLFHAGLDAAMALPGRSHLRLVDVASSADQIAQQDPNHILHHVAELTSEAADSLVTLSLENAKQPWARLRQLPELVAEVLEPTRPRLRLCYDACNLLQAADKPDTKQVVESLKASDLAMIHFKQARAGEIQPTVCDGDIDWRHQLDCLQRAGFDGPALFELPPHERIWDHLHESREYLQGLGLFSE